MLAAQYNSIVQDVTEVQLNRVEKPTSSPGVVVVKVHVAAVNPIDSKVMRGYLVGAGWTLPLPFNVGYDFSGVVESVDPSDTGTFSVGDEVFAVNWGVGSHNDEQGSIGGAFAEYIKIPLSKLSRKPADVSFEQAAAVALVGTTAYQILFDCAKVTAGSRVLILGGPSAVGQVAIQLAKARGAWVATTSSTRNLEYVAQFGADLVVDYTTTKWDELEALKGLDAVVDTVGDEHAFLRSTEHHVVRPDGYFVSIANMEAGFDPLGHPPLQYAAFHCLSNSVAIQDELVAALAAGTLHITIDQVFPFTLEGVHGILKRIESKVSTGKSLLKIVA
jgi:NADPH:quinone reductase-like Zn-dependent oxidoreductase